MLGAGEYTVLDGGELRHFTHWDQLPPVFDNLVKFLPTIPPGPHTDEQHEAIEGLVDTFRQFMGRERNASSNARG